MWPEAQRITEMLDLARAGDAMALDHLLAECRDPLRRAVDLRLDPQLARREDASDIVQKALLEAHRRFRDYLHDPKMPFALWLRQIAQDRIIDAHRRHQAAARRSLDREQAQHVAAGPDASSIQLVAQLVDQELTPASAAIQQELAQRLEEILSQLDEIDREIILMRYYEQMSNQEIATALDLSEAAASMRHLRALRRLKDAFSGNAESGS